MAYFLLGLVGFAAGITYAPEMMRNLFKTLLGLAILIAAVGGLLLVHQSNEDRQNRLEAEAGQAKADAEYQARKVCEAALPAELQAFIKADDFAFLSSCPTTPQDIRKSLDEYRTARKARAKLTASQ